MRFSQFLGFRCMYGLSRASTATRAALVGAGACEAVMQGLQPFLEGTDQELLRAGCQAMTYLAGSSQGQKRLVEAGAREAVRGTMVALPTDKLIKQTMEVLEKDME